MDSEERRKPGLLRRLLGFSREVATETATEVVQGTGRLIKHTLWCGAVGAVAGGVRALVVDTGPSVVRSAGAGFLMGAVACLLVSYLIAEIF